MVIEGTQASSPCPDTGPRDGCTWWSVTFRRCPVLPATSAEPQAGCAPVDGRGTPGGDT